MQRTELEHHKREVEVGESALFSPGNVVSLLLQGESVCVMEHYLFYDVDLGVTWITNPYGVDGILCNRPDAKVLQEFMVFAAEGGAYGPCPE